MNHETCIEKLEQFVLDEYRIVTYKVLSRELNIHVNEAKQYLQEFLEKQKSENVSLNVMYFLAGVIENGIKIFVVPEKDLEKTKNSLSEITSCHIYSISKKKICQEQHDNYNICKLAKLLISCFETLRVDMGSKLYLTDENHNKNDQELINFLVITS
ncbi:DNA polymerase delta subunit 3 [Caerostris extrusa]|uniref:DNA polymerase delta subunit 3 n=1 Tax=Caerostris extrusa TaxID=172846 RepID=A0AAV4XKH0_CAEEX|nr:DNA polymerase delta subunit 3 [Caerostris extrusa]